MTQSVLNSFNMSNKSVKLWAFNLLKYGIRSFLKTRFKLIKINQKTLFIERINYKKFRSER